MWTGVPYGAQLIGPARSHNPRRKLREPNYPLSRHSRPLAFQAHQVGPITVDSARLLHYSLYNCRQLRAPQHYYQ